MALFQRAFPTAEVSAHATYDVGGRLVRYAPALHRTTRPPSTCGRPSASLLREFRRTARRLSRPVGQHLAADPARVAHWKQVLDEQAPAGPKVGLLWKSADRKDARHRYFSPFDAWAPVLAQKGVTFVNMQYGDCSEELAYVKRELGVEIWTPPGIDLKQDLDDLAALSSAMDLVVGFSNATLNIAAACGERRPG